MSHGTYLRARKRGAAQHWGVGVKLRSHSLLVLKLEVRDYGYETVNFIWSQAANWPSSSIAVFAATEFSKNPLGLTAVSRTLNAPTFQGLSFSRSSGTSTTTKEHLTRLSAREDFIETGRLHLISHFWVKWNRSSAWHRPKEETIAWFPSVCQDVRRGTYGQPEGSQNLSRDLGPR